ncbi:MAG TPA: HD domain-containing protein [Roseiflexaceae bacterium]|nr:HD domain-containing protein [Roseiflexaceae bacterium]
MSEWSQAVGRVAGLLEQGDTAGIRTALMGPLEQPGGGGWLAALDEAGLLTRLIPELEPGRATSQPSGHFLPVLAHQIEAARAADWLIAQLDAATLPDAALPAAVRRHPGLRWPTRYAETFRTHLGTPLAGDWSRGALLKLAALLHDIGKPATKRVAPNGKVTFHDHSAVGAGLAEPAAQRLRFAPEEVAYLRQIVKEHMRPGQLGSNGPITQRTIDRFFRATEPSGPDVLLHTLADHMAARGPNLDPLGWRRHILWTDALLDSCWGDAQDLTPPLLDGHRLMQELGLPPGPLVGQLLAAVGEAQADGTISTPEEALALARRELAALR